MNDNKHDQLLLIFNKYKINENMFEMIKNILIKKKL